MPSPYFGCSICRRRKIKCDLRAASGCFNCERYGAECPGYPATIDVLMRNTTVTAESTRNAPPMKPKKNVSTITPRKKARARRATAPEVPIKVERLLTVDREDIKVGLFYAAWCTKDSPMLSPEQLRSLGNGCLYAAIEILGFDAMNQAARSTTSVYAMHQKYSCALQLLQASLQSPREAREDYVLITTMLLSVVPSKMSSQKTLQDWVAHVQGAASLLTLRGPEQVLTLMGTSLYLQVSSQIFAICLTTGVPLPAKFRQLRDDIMPLLQDPNDPIWCYHGVMLTFVEFMSAKAPLIRDVTVDPHAAQEVALEALAIYDDIEAVFSGPSSIWQYTTTKSGTIYQGTTHRHFYQSCMVAHMWNGRRIATIALLDTIRAATRWFANDDTWRFLTDKQKQRCLNTKQIVNLTAHDILASCPQQVEFVLAQHRNSAAREKQTAGVVAFENTQFVHHLSALHYSNDDQQQLPRVMLTGGFWGFFGVYFAALSDATTASLRNNLLRVLEIYGSQIGVKQAATLATTVRESHDCAAAELETLDEFDAILEESDSSAMVIASLEWAFERRDSPVELQDWNSGDSSEEQDTIGWHPTDVLQSIEI